LAQHIYICISVLGKWLLSSDNCWNFRLAVYFGPHTADCLAGVDLQVAPKGCFPLFGSRRLKRFNANPKRDSATHGELCYAKSIEPV
jgi:hypothetical protein